jgi:thiosulfate dehydrogenase
MNHPARCNRVAGRPGLVVVQALALPVALLGAAGCPEPEVVQVERSAVEHGRALAADPSLGGSEGNALSCLTCHAERAGDGGGSIFPGGPLAGATRRSSYWGGSEPSLLGAINHCRYYFQLADTPWTGDEVEARAIYAYLESLEPGDDEPVAFTLGKVADPGPGDPTRGADLYARACASCHGAKSTGLDDSLRPRAVANAPILPEQTLAEHPLDEYTKDERRLVFVEKTRHGTFYGYGGQMPPFSLESLSDNDMADLLAYLGVEGD